MRVLLIICIFSLFGVNYIAGQSTDFERITLEQGLSQGMVFDILQTRDGFLWVATKDGLNRYDGYNFRIFSNITHEFRTPLTLILEPARRILAKTNDPDIRENARHVESNSRRLLTLVNQLLDMAKLESGSMGADLRQGDLEEQVRLVFRSFQPLAEQRNIQLSLKSSGDIPPFLFDTGKVDLILNNLISNALKFTPAGGKVTVACLQEQVGNKQVRISVSDTGIGIPQDALDKVFDR